MLHLWLRSPADSHCGVVAKYFLHVILLHTVLSLEQKFWDMSTWSEVILDMLSAPVPKVVRKSSFLCTFGRSIIMDLWEFLLAGRLSSVPVFKPSGMVRLCISWVGASSGNSFDSVIAANSASCHVGVGLRLYGSEVFSTLLFGYLVAYRTTRHDQSIWVTRAGAIYRCCRTSCVFAFSKIRSFLAFRLPSFLLVGFHRRLNFF